MKISLPFFFLLGLAMSSSAFAYREGDWKAVTFGMGVPQFSLKVQDKDRKEEAMIRNKGTVIPTIGFARLPQPFWSSLQWLRGSIEFSVSGVSANRQDTSRLLNGGGRKDKSGVTLGTGVNGYMGYVNPTLVLYLGATHNIYFYGGLGLGVGFASMKGDYYRVSGPNASLSCLGSSMPLDVKANCDKEKINFSGVDLGTNFVMVANLGWFGARFEIGGPQIREDDKYFAANNSMLSLYAQYRF